MPVKLFKVPRRLWWHITMQVDGADQSSYWRMYWYQNLYRRRQRVEKLTAVLTFPLLMGYALVVQSWPRMLVACCVWVLLNYMLRRWSRHYLTASDCIYDSDPRKWRSISAAATPVCEACVPDDPLVTVAVALPDE